MYPREIVDSDEYSPNDNLVLLTTKKQNKKPQSQCYHFPSVHFMLDVWGWFPVGLIPVKSRSHIYYGVLVLEGMGDSESGCAVWERHSLLNAEYSTNPSQ